MGLFDFVGTFFFLSLGITFVLILLLVYHFKQRLTDMEQKSDKMFEIVNTIVKEMGNMRRVISQIAQEPQDVLPSAADYREQHRYDSDDDADVDADADDNQDDECFPHSNPIVYNIGDANRVMNDFFHINTHTAEEDEEESIKEEPDHVEQVKVVSVDLTYNEDDVKTDEEASVLSDFGDFEPEDIHATLPTSGEEVIHVNKLDEPMTPIVDEEEHEVSHNEEHQIPYSKMNLTQLRAYAVSRGLLSDSGKMKKAELIKLLEGNDAENQQSSG